MAIAYNVYSNTGVGDAINYAAPVAVVTNATTWTTAALQPNGDYWFGVRAFDTVSGLEEENIDCAVEIVLDNLGNDITNRPNPPIGLRALGTQGGGIKVEWFHAALGPVLPPTGFNVYLGTGGTPNYSSAAASVLYSMGFLNRFSTALAGLVDGVSYTIAVRAYNANGEEKNGTVVTMVAKVNGPLPVVGLTAIAMV